jgi:hypothetical protein
MRPRRRTKKEDSGNFLDSKLQIVAIGNSGDKGVFIGQIKV